MKKNGNPPGAYICRRLVQARIYSNSCEICSNFICIHCYALICPYIKLTMLVYYLVYVAVTGCVYLDAPHQFASRFVCPEHARHAILIIFNEKHKLRDVRRISPSTTVMLQCSVCYYNTLVVPIITCQAECLHIVALPRHLLLS